jgi:hypothetical protein
MSQLIGKISQSKSVSSLDTYNQTIVTAGIYTVSVGFTEVPPSGLNVVIQQNGTQKSSASVLANTQQQLNQQIILNCASADVISIVVSSSNAVDYAPGALKGIINIRQGVS